MQVVLMGKPGKDIYDEALQLLQLEPSEVLAIGDSLQHDVAGAAGVGIDTLFIAGGIHAAELLPSGQVHIDKSALGTLLAQYEHRPTYTMPFLQA